MSYPMVNRRPTIHAWWAYNTDDPAGTGGLLRQWGDFGQQNPGWFNVYDPFAYDHRTIVNNGITKPALHNAQMMFFIEGDVIVGPRTIKNGDHQVITPYPDKREKTVVSVEAAVQALNASLNGQTKVASKAAQNDDTLDKVIQVATAVLGALAGAVSTGMSVPSPGGKAGFGVGKASLDFLGGMLQQAGSMYSEGDSEGPPAPPSIDEIKAAVKEVVTEVVTDVVQKEAAKEAAMLFAENYDYFSSLGREIVEINGRPPQPLVDDFNGYLDKALDRAHLDSFASKLASIRDDQDNCKYILPEYITAAGLYLTLNRLHFARTYIPDSGEKPAPKAVPAEPIRRLLGHQAVAHRPRQCAKVLYRHEKCVRQFVWTERHPRSLRPHQNDFEALPRR